MKKLLFTFSLLLSALIAYCQTTPSPVYLKPNNAFGTRSNRAEFDSTMFYPTGCGVPTDSTFLFTMQNGGRGEKPRMSAFYYDSCTTHQTYKWSPETQTWSALGVALDTTSLSNRINGKVTNSGGMAFIGSGIDASKPAASTGKGVYYATDLGVFEYSDATTWTLVSGGGSSLTAIGGGVVIVSGNIEIGGTMTKDVQTTYNGFVQQIIPQSPAIVGDVSNVVWSVRSPSQGTGNGDFTFLVESINDGQADTSHNEVMKWGWNINHVANPVAPGEHYAMEDMYNPFNNGRLMENHLELDMLDGNHIRLFSNTTQVTMNDSSVASSQWDFRSSKFNFMDIPGNQCIEVQLANAKSSVTFYWDQLIDATAMQMGWTDDATGFNLTNFAGGSHDLLLVGWAAVEVGGPMLIAGNVEPQSDVTYDIGFSTQRWRTINVQNVTTNNIKVSDDFSFPTGDPSAKVDIQTTTQGILIPRMTDAQMNAISAPAVALMVFNTDSVDFRYFNGTVWVKVGNGGGGGGSAPPFSDAGNIIMNASDNTKVLKYDLSALSTATAVTVTVPNTNLIMAGINITQTYTAKQIFAGIEVSTAQIGGFYRSLAHLESSLATTYTAQTTDNMMLVDAGTAPFVITLPSAASGSGILVHGDPHGIEYIITKEDNSVNTVTIIVDNVLSESINGSPSITLTTQYQTVHLICVEGSISWVKY